MILDGNRNVHKLVFSSQFLRYSFRIQDSCISCPEKTKRPTAAFAQDPKNKAAGPQVKQDICLAEVGGNVHTATASACVWIHFQYCSLIMVEEVCLVFGWPSVGCVEDQSSRVLD